MPIHLKPHIFPQAYSPDTNTNMQYTEYITY